MRLKNTFGINVIPNNEVDRIIALQRYNLLDTPPENTFDNLATIATQIFQVPISLIALIDEKRIFFKANIGLGNIRNVNRDVCLCSLTVLKPEITVFKDTLKEPELFSNPNVVSEFGLRFYAGVPLITHDGYQIGTLCIADRKAKNFTVKDERMLTWLANLVMEEIELRSSTTNKNDKNRMTGKNLTDTGNFRSFLQHPFHEGDIRFSNMMQKAPVALALLTGQDLIIESANETTLKIFGKTEKIIGMPLAIALPDLERQFFLKLLNAAYSSGQPYYGNETKVEIEYDGQLRDIYFNFVYQPLLDDTGATYAIMVVANEVTDLVIARKEKEKAEEMLRFAVEAANVGTWYIDMGTGTFMPSPRLKELFGYYHEDDMPYEIAVNQIVEEYREKVIDSVKATLISGVRFNMEFPILGFHDQKLRWVRAVGKLNHNAKLNLSNYSGVIMDITEQKQDELRKNDFIAMVSHELKTPLSSLKAYVQYISTQFKRKKSDADFVLNLLSKVDTQVNKMTSMINGFLSLSCLESGKIQLHKTFFNLDELVKEIINDTMLVSPNHFITLPCCDSIHIYADREKISQVVTNFLSNADKYSPKGQLIEVKCQLVNDLAKVSVKDEGMGIKPHYIERLFERYFRIESKHTSNISGFGIGLYLCSEIIQHHNGKIGVDSEIGKGSTFWFTLPLQKLDLNPAT